MSWRAVILGMKEPLAQRYAFARYVLGESRWDAMLLAAAFQHLGRIDAVEYDAVNGGWVAA